MCSASSGLLATNPRGVVIPCWFITSILIYSLVPICKWMHIECRYHMREKIDPKSWETLATHHEHWDCELHPSPGLQHEISWLWRPPDGYRLPQMKSWRWWRTVDIPPRLYNWRYYLWTAAGVSSSFLGWLFAVWCDGFLRFDLDLAERYRFAGIMNTYAVWPSSRNTQLSVQVTHFSCFIFWPDSCSMP